MSYEEALAMISRGPQETEKELVKKGIKPKPAKRKPKPDRVIATFSCHDASENKKRIQWPPKRCKARMRLRANRHVEFEFSTWGKKKEEDELYGCYEEEWFMPLEYGDSDAAVLRVWGELIESAHHLRLKVNKVEELRNGDRPPPLTEEDIHLVCGKSLLNGIDGHWQTKEQLSLTIDRQRDKILSFTQDADGGWAKAESDDEEQEV